MNYTSFLVLLLSTLSVAKDHCHPTQFQCHDRTCINLENKCDGVNDCAYGEDEYGCSCLVRDTLKIDFDLEAKFFDFWWDINSGALNVYAHSYGSDDTKDVLLFQLYKSTCTKDVVGPIPIINAVAYPEIIDVARNQWYALTLRFVNSYYNVTKLDYIVHTNNKERSGMYQLQHLTGMYTLPVKLQSNKTQIKLNGTALTMGCFRDKYWIVKMGYDVKIPIYNKHMNFVMTSNVKYSVVLLVGGKTIVIGSSFGRVAVFGVRELHHAYKPLQPNAVYTLYVDHIGGLFQLIIGGKLAFETNESIEYITFSNRGRYGSFHVTVDAFNDRSDEDKAKYSYLKTGHVSNRHLLTLTPITFFGILSFALLAYIIRYHDISCTN
ncbi:hypothetical protein PvNV_098 [Penaeus vannamei nudivirus]|nr:MAM and LDL receptor class A domain containing protein 1 [Penaeus vannamei nucleopolyhedrovirus]